MRSPRSLKTWLRLALGRVRLHRVTGESMCPTFDDGVLIVLDPRAYSNRLPRPGEVVVAKHPFRRTEIVKRVVSVDARGRLRLAGDNPAQSTDSRSFGTVSVDAIAGRVVAHLGR